MRAPIIHKTFAKIKYFLIFYKNIKTSTKQLTNIIFGLKSNYLMTKVLKRIFTAFLIVVFMATKSLASWDCDNEKYRQIYPEKCQTSKDTNKVLLSLAGGAALVGLGIALATQNSGNSSSSSPSNPETVSRDFLSPNININYAQTDIIKNQRIASSYLNSLTNGTDIDAQTIQNIKQSHTYQKNYNQYNAVNIAWARARGFSGANSTIAIIDDFQSNHGDTVHYILYNVAPNANISKNNIATSANNFDSFDAIANTISNTPANIYNASWQIPANENFNAATAVYNQISPKNYAEAQEYMHNITSKNFITQMRNSAVDNDAIFVFAAGNDGQTESGALSALPIAFPDLQGHFVNVIALNNYGTIAWYSNQCGITQNYCIAAPGSGWDTDTQDYASGTSFATPVISGAIATIKEAFPYMTSSQITALLFTTATDLGAPGIDSVYGWGVLDMEKATKPVGTPKIVLNNETILPLRPSNVSGPIGEAIKNANIEIAFLDDFGRAFKTNLSNNIKVIPYGRGFEKLTENENDTITLFDNFELGFKQNHFMESNGFLATQSNQLTHFIGYKNEFNFDNVKFYQNARFGVFHPNTEENSIISGFSNIYTAALKFGSQWKKWSVEFAVPETITSGKMFVTVPTERTPNGDIIYKDIDLKLYSRPATEYTIKYDWLSTTFIKNHNQENEFLIMAKKKCTF